MKNKKALWGVLIALALGCFTAAMMFTVLRSTVAGKYGRTSIALLSVMAGSKLWTLFLPIAALIAAPFAFHFLGKLSARRFGTHEPIYVICSVAPSLAMSVYWWIWLFGSVPEAGGAWFWLIGGVMGAVSFTVCEVVIVVSCVTAFISDKKRKQPLQPQAPPVPIKSMPCSDLRYAEQDNTDDKDK